jgi:hypothetical protein
MLTPGRDPVCPVCSKLIAEGTFVILEHGELFHVRCRSQALHSESMEDSDAISGRPQRPVDLARSSTQTPRVRQQQRCPVCGEPATILDWRPSVPWLSIDGCACNGLFAWAPLLDGNLSALSPTDRATLCHQVQAVRKTGSEAWLTTRDGTPRGEIIIRDERPDRHS